MNNTKTTTARKVAPAVNVEAPTKADPLNTLKEAVAYHRHEAGKTLGFLKLMEDLKHTGVYAALNATRARDAALLNLNVELGLYADATDELDTYVDSLDG